LKRREIPAFAGMTVGGEVPHDCDPTGPLESEFARQSVKNWIPGSSPGMTWFQRPGKRPSPKMIAPVGEPTGVLCAGTDCGSGDRHAKTKLSDRVV